MRPEQQVSEIKEFQGVMLKELEENMWKGGWHDCTPDQLIDRVQEELAEVRDELSKLGSRDQDLGRVYSECSDVANMVAMVASRVKMMVLRSLGVPAFKSGQLDPEARIPSVEEAVTLAKASSPQRNPS